MEKDGELISATSKTFFVVCILLVLLVLVCIGCVRESHDKQVYKVGVMSGLAYFNPILDGFKERMTELGYVEGQDIIYIFEEPNFDPDKEQQAIQKFIEEEVDLILAFPTECALAAKAGIQETGISLVFAASTVEGNNLIKDIPKLGGHITGVRFPSIDNTVKRFEILMELMPNAKNIWIPYMRDYYAVPPQMEQLYKTIPNGVKITEIPVSSPQEFDTTLREKIKTGEAPDAILTINEPLVGIPAYGLVLGKFAGEYKIPVGGSMYDASCEGCFESIFALIIDNIGTGRLAALIADKILQGTEVGTIPVVTPENYLIINYRKSQELGLNVSEGLLVRAHKIIR